MMDSVLEELKSGSIEAMTVGVIGFDDANLVQEYNQIEADAAGLRTERVIGTHIFESVAPCMNNFLVAQRFHDAAANDQQLDVTIDYVLTLRMRPTPVRLRLLSIRELRYRYILVYRQ